jgi:putative ABC transport system permease protein
MNSVSFFLRDILQSPLTMVTVLLSAVPCLLGVVLFALNPKLLALIVKNLNRNRVRTILTCLAIMVLVFMITLIWTVVFTLDRVTSEQAKDLKVIITERWQLPSTLPMTYANYLDPQRPEFILKEFGITSKDFMYWSFYGGTMDPNKMTLESLVFFFVMEPDQIIPMMDDLNDLDPGLVEKLKAKPEACLLGRDKLATVGKRVGERFKLISLNYKGIDLEFEVVGKLPDGRYDNSGIMNASYFKKSFDKYQREKGSPHPLANRPLNLIWLRVPDKDTFSQIAHAVENAPVLSDPQVKCETASSGIAAFLDVYRDLLWGVKWLLVPAILASMALVVSNAISISVRERIKEIAVLKVLGFHPRQILVLVLGESMMVGGLSGLLAAGSAFWIFNVMMGGLKFPIGFFPAFLVPVHAFGWGLAIGFTTAFLGAIFPALTARSVKVSEVFAKVT